MVSRLEQTGCKHKIVVTKEIARVQTNADRLCYIQDTISQCFSYLTSDHIGREMTQSEK